MSRFVEKWNFPLFLAVCFVLVYCFAHSLFRSLGLNLLIRLSSFGCLLVYIVIYKSPTNTALFKARVKVLLQLQKFSWRDIKLFYFSLSKLKFTNSDVKLKIRWISSLFILTLFGASMMNYVRYVENNDTCLFCYCVIAG